MVKRFNRQSEQNTRRLWGREFHIVDKGLKEEEVIAFVEDLIAEYKASPEGSEDLSARSNAQVEPEIEEMAGVAEIDASKENVVPQSGGVTLEDSSDQHPPEEQFGKEISSLDSLTPKSGDQKIYTGEVELVIAKPVNLKTLNELYAHLQTITELKVLRTAGSWDNNITVTLSLEEPMPLISLITKKLEAVEVVSESPEQHSPINGKREARRVRLTLGVK